ncbi:type VII secretion protein EccB, partial [Micromonospora zhanjiangensis]
MATRRDQLQSYQFMTQRVISAFVMRETDPAQSPLRRGVGAVFGGLMVAVLVAAGFGIYGLLTKIGSAKWKNEGAVVVEKETGATYVYVGGVLHPTLNFASAMLASGRPNPAVFPVSANSLDGVPRDTTIGIPGAPTSLPGVKKLAGMPWSVCAVPGTDAGGQPSNVIGLAVSSAPTGAVRMGDDGLLVTDGRGGLTYLVWHGQRYRVHDAKHIVPALFGAVTPVRVGTAWLDAMPAGSDIENVQVDKRGEPSGSVPGRQIGDVLVAQTGSGPQSYLVFADGLAPITPLQQAILSIDKQVRPVEVTVGEVTSAPRSGRLRSPTGNAQPPTSPPKLVNPAPDAPVCAVTSNAKDNPVVMVGGTVSGLDTAPRTPSSTSTGVSLADRVLVPAGRVAVVRGMGSPTAESGPYYVVTDLGIKYPVPSAAVLPLLGYAPDQATDVPVGLVSRIPSGPTLDPAEAIKPAPVTDARAG